MRMRVRRTSRFVRKSVELHRHTCQIGEYEGERGREYALIRVPVDVQAAQDRRVRRGREGAGVDWDDLVRGGGDVDKLDLQGQ